MRPAHGSMCPYCGTTVQHNTQPVLLAAPSVHTSSVGFETLHLKQKSLSAKLCALQSEFGHRQSPDRNSLVDDLPGRTETTAVRKRVVSTRAACSVCVCVCVCVCEVAAATIGRVDTGCADSGLYWYARTWRATDAMGQAVAAFTLD